MPRPKNIGGLFSTINAARIDLSRNPEKTLNHLGSIPGGVESLSTEILDDVYAYIHDNQEEIKRTFSLGGEKVFERRLDKNDRDEQNANARSFIIKQDPITDEFYVFITTKSKRADGTKYADAEDPAVRIAYKSGKFSECKIAFELLGDSIQPFVELVPKKDEDGFRKDTSSNLLKKELAASGNAVTRPIEVTVHRDGKTHIVKFAPYRPKTFANIYNDPNLTIEQKLEYFAKLLVSVHDLHASGVVHLDIKPENILIDESGNVSLGDLDTVAKIGSNLVSVNPVGTSIYMAPELIIDNVNRIADKLDMTLSQVTDSPPVRRDMAKSYASSHTTVEDFEEPRRPLDVSPAQDTWSLSIMLYEIIYQKRMDMTEIMKPADTNESDPYPTTISEMYRGMFKYALSAYYSGDSRSLSDGTAMNLSEKIGITNSEIEKFKSIITLADQMQNIESNNCGSLLQITSSINDFIKANPNAKSEIINRQMISEDGNPILDLIKNKNAKAWPGIKNQLKDLLLVGASSESQRIIEDCFKSESMAAVANAAIRILNNRSTNKITTDEQAMLTNKLSIIHKASQYLQSNNSSSWNLMSNQGQQKKELLMQILRHELILKTTNSANPNNKSFTRTFGANHL
jgi:serine/threonine protein kinase